MSEIDSRPTATRGRSSVRGGRGGFGRGAPRGGYRSTNGASTLAEDSVSDEPAEIAELKKQYSSQLPLLKDMFPDWSDVDLVFALQETDGDLQTTIEKITEGHISQFSEIKKPKDRARSKVKDAAPVEPIASRGATRGRGGLEGSRARGRGDRAARGVSRGGRGGATLPVVKDQTETTQTSGIPEGSSWGASASTTAAPKEKETPAATTETKPQAEESTEEKSKTEAIKAAVPTVIKKTWASMFSQPKPAPVATPKLPAARQEPAAAEKPAAPAATEEPVVSVAAPEETSTTAQAELPAETAVEPEAPTAPLTEDNLEHLPDTSIPPATQTAASTVGSDLPGKATPLESASQTPGPRPAIGGYAQAAMRATGMTPRSASYQRRVQEQQEAVVLPGHNSIDRAAVQFGSMGLNGDAADVDEEREDAETRAQPPQQSPAQPRTSLPPSQAAAPVQDSYTAPASQTPKQAPGLPPVQQQPHQLESQQTQQHAYNQYGRYGQQDVHAPSQKQYDPFSHQAPTGFDQYSSHSHSQSQQQGQQGGYGGYSAPSDYSQYYGSEQQRNAYQNYYGASYGQPQGQQDQSQQRTGAGIGGAQGESAFGSAQSTQQSQGRYESQGASQEAQPSAATPGQQPASQAQQHQGQPQNQYNSGYPYGHPYYNSPYAAAYQNQFSSYNAYGAPYGKQGGMYGQPHGYGGYEQHASTPGSNYPASTQQSRESGLGSAATGSDYGRSSTQPSSTFGGQSDYNRPQQGGYPYSGAGAQQSAASGEDLKSYGSNAEAKPSPSLAQGRPASAANTTLPAPQHQGPPPTQQGYNNYPFNGSGQYGSGLGGLGGAAGSQQQQNYGTYGGFGANTGYNQYGRGGWGNSYGGH